MTESWDRVEGRARTDDLRGGIEARIADPLWMLARQWQVGEFIGDDAGEPLAFTISYESSRLDGFLEDWPGIPKRIDGATPLEYDVEASPPPMTGGARLAATTRLAHRLRRMLRRSGFADVAERIAEAFPPPPIDDDDLVLLGDRGHAVADLLRDRSSDVYALAVAPPNVLRAGLKKLAVESIDDIIDVIQDWQRLAHARYPLEFTDAWKSERMEHSFVVSAPTTGDAPLVLAAKEHPGGHLDWYSFDVMSGSKHPLAKEPDVETFTALPAPVVYPGMPAPRWWEFEDRAVQFGDINAEPTDLARMLVADFATVYSDDWYVVPLRLPVGSAARVRQVDVVDTFGRTSRATSTAASDTRGPLGRSWSMFELFGDRSVANDQAPILLIPPALVASLHGPVLEQVEFVRDEGANLGWAIERTVEGPLGRAVDRRDTWAATRPPEPRSIEPSGSAEADYANTYWRYRAEAPAPPFWIPLLPQRISDSSPEIEFRRGQMQSWDQLEPHVVGVKGQVLVPNQPLRIREEEIPRGGIRVERRWQLARWHDGSVHLWVQRQKRQGRGERSSGLRWDQLIESVAPIGERSRDRN